MLSLATQHGCVVVPPRRRPVVVPPRPKPYAKPTSTCAKPTPRLDWSSDSSSDWRWNSWNSKQKWIQDDRYQEKGSWREESHTDAKQIANPWGKDPSEADTADYEMEFDMVSGNEALSVEDNNDYSQWTSGNEALSVEDNNDYSQWTSGNEALSVEDNNDYSQWTYLRQKWEDEKTGHDNDADEYEYIQEEEDDNEELIKRTREVLQRHRGKAPAYRSSKRERSPRHQPSRRQRGKALSKRAKAKRADKAKYSKVEIAKLRYSQASCKDQFQCGRKMSQLVQALLDKKVRLSAPFLRLTVFETTDPQTKEPILRCIDNRRLCALKEYAKRSGKDRMMVNVELFDNYTLKQVQRFIKNSDDTDGRAVRLRQNTSNTPCRKSHPNRK